MSDLAGLISIDDWAGDYVAAVTSTSPLEVEFRGQVLSAINGVPNQPITVGDPVRVTRFAQQLVVAGNMAAYPTTAVVSAYAAGGANCTVVIGDDTIDAQTLGTYVPTVGDRVALLWMANQAGNAFCFCSRRGAAMADPPTPPDAPNGMNLTTGPDLPVPPPPPTGPGTATLYAQQTGTYLDGGSLFTGDQANYWLYSGNRGGVTGSPAVGFWFYGDQPAKIRGATVTKCEVWVQRAAGVGPTSASPFHMFLHGTKTRTSLQPAGVLDFREDLFSLKPGQSAWVTLPTAWGQLIANNAAAGVGILTQYGTDIYKALIGISHPDPTKRNVQSGALKITYTRS